MAEVRIQIEIDHTFRVMFYISNELIKEYRNLAIIPENLITAWLMSFKS